MRGSRLVAGIFAFFAAVSSVSAEEPEAVVLDAARRRPAVLWTDFEIERFAAQARRFRDGAVRAEALRFLGELELERGDADAAARDLGAALEGPWSASTRHVLASDYARALLEAGEFGAAREVVLREGLSGTSVGKHALRLASARRERFAASAVVGVFVLIAVGQALRAARAGRIALSVSWPVMIAFAIVVPWSLARAYDRAMSDSFARLGLGVVIAVVLARVASGACASPRSRFALASLAVACVVAVGFLARQAYGL